MTLYIYSIFGANVGFEYLPAPDDEPEIKGMLDINFLFVQLCFVFWKD